MNNIVNELRALAADVGRGGDGWNFDIVGLAESAADACEQMKRERDAAVADIKWCEDCRVCANKSSWCDQNPDACKGWRWRGPQEQEGEDECSD